MREISETLERFRRGGSLLDSALSGVADAELDWTPEDGKWSLRQIVAHVADAEAVWVMRFRQLIAEENPVMPAWNQELWTTRLDYSRRKPSDAIDTFRRLRADNHELLSGIAEEDYARSGTHTKRGTMTLHEFLALATDHAESHAKQIHGLRAAYAEQVAR